MSIEPVVPGEPRRPHGPRDPGDAWVVAEDGTRYWGRFGAAGLLVWDASRGPVGSVLLQHRVAWSHHGGTWGIPGGALNQGESAEDGAVREAGEEAGVPADAVRRVRTSVLDLEIWTYTTVVAEVTRPFEPVIADPESVALAWVPVGEVAALPLHPGFAAAWPALSAEVAVRRAVVVDGANVVGSVPDGWWKDRAAAAGRLGEALAEWAARGMPREAGGVEYPEVVLVVEGQARALPDAEAPGVVVVRAPGAGDDAIVAEAVRRVEGGDEVIVVTSDRELVERVEGVGALARGARWLRDQF